jgi:hypothetical protein
MIHHGASSETLVKEGGTEITETGREEPHAKTLRPKE